MYDVTLVKLLIDVSLVKIDTYNISINYQIIVPVSCTRSLTAILYTPISFGFKHVK